MPAIAFDPRAAILVHTLVGLDPAALEVLQPEDYLLIHRESVRATRQTERKINAAGRCFARIDYDPVLRYSVSAEVLALHGLANWHPGLNLNLAQVPGVPTLDFNNAAFQPFGFGALSPRRLIYENPELDIVGGDLPGLTFEIVDEFNDVDPENPGFDLPDPASFIPSWPFTPTGGQQNWMAKHGQALVWMRVLNLAANGHPMCPADFEYFQGVPPSHPDLPATPGELDRAAIGMPEDAAQDAVAEIFDLRPPGGAYWLPEGALDGTIAALMPEAVLPLEGYAVAMQLRVIATDEYHYILQQGDWADLAAFLADQPAPPGEEYTAVYHLPGATWWLGP